ncbi:hypothetical protein [Shewanella xiamenensis]|uniref:hypothetical protein n=1 Tax=Shewanella xiamenensis TaxID=332186 RepID=UPI0021794AD9|nr:hypothetical protein [Shewanella xiamenensis]BDQ68746.1 hypothetical protein NUITMVS2_45590 [Shewanella xiamenensis]GLD79954.1 hypothetical protein NUITMVS3_43920 [Shewanella xiamenensis]
MANSDHTLKTTENESYALLKPIFPTLTKRQIQVMKDLSVGMTPSQIQAKDQCSRTAIEKILTDIRAEFGCSSSNEIRTVFLNNLLLKTLLIINLKKGE